MVQFGERTRYLELLCIMIWAILAILIPFNNYTTAEIIDQPLFEDLSLPSVHIIFVETIIFYGNAPLKNTFGGQTRSQGVNCYLTKRS